MKYQLAFRRYRLPFRTPVRTGHGVWLQREGLIVRAENASGAVGFGEVAPLPWFGTEDLEEAEEVCRALGTSVELEALQEIPDKCPCTRFGLETALAAVDGNVPEFPAGAFVPVAALLPAGKAALEKIDTLGAAGFRTFKWKVGAGDARDEMVLLDDLLGMLPKGASLRLDANGAWNRKLAEQWLSLCADRPIEFVEQPIAAEDRGASGTRKEMDLLLGLASDYPTPIALDESVSSSRDVQGWIGQGWPGVYVLKLSLLGNVGGTLQQLQAAGVSDRIVFSSALETGIGARGVLRYIMEYVSSQRAAKVPVRAIGFGVWPLFEDSRFDGPRVAPFIRAEDLNISNQEDLWNVLN